MIMMVILDKKNDDDDDNKTIYKTHTHRHIDKERERVMID